MKTYVASRPVVLFCVALTPAFLPGQTGISTPSLDEVPPAARAMVEAGEYRAALTDDIVAGREQVPAILEKLRGRGNAMGLGFDVDTDFALAAMDIGHRLIALRKPAEAEVFFIEAEAAFGLAIDDTPDRAARAKAGLLEKRAFIRANYLNKTPEADADFEKAIALQPDDQRLKRQRAVLPSEKTGRKDKKPGEK